MKPGGRPRNLHLVSHAGQTIVRTDIAADLRPKDGIEPDVRLTRLERDLWDRYVRRCHWLSDLDRSKAVQWVRMEALSRRERSWETWPTPKLVELRRLASELGLDPLARIKIATDRKKTDDPAEEYF